MTNRIMLSVLTLVLALLFSGCGTSIDTNTDASVDEVVAGYVSKFSEKQINQIAGTPVLLRNLQITESLSLDIHNRFDITNAVDGSGSISDYCASRSAETDISSDDGFRRYCALMIVEKIHEGIDKKLPQNSRLMLFLQGYLISTLEFDELLSPLKESGLSTIEIVQFINRKLSDEGMPFGIEFAADVVLESGGFSDQRRNANPSLPAVITELSLETLLVTIINKTGFCAQHRPGQIILAVDCSQEYSYWDWMSAS